MRQRSSDDEEDRPTAGNSGKNASILNDEKTSKSPKEKPSKSPAHVPSTEKSLVSQSKATESAPPPPPQPQRQSMKMDTDLDINDVDDDIAIIPDDDADLTIMGDEEMQEIEKDLFPTITSVTSLHPGGNERFSELFENSSVL